MDGSLMIISPLTLTQNETADSVSCYSQILIRSEKVNLRIGDNDSRLGYILDEQLSPSILA